MCEELFVKTDGSVHWCGCSDAPKVGHVFDAGRDEWTFPEDYEEGTCWHTYVVNKEGWQ